MFLWWASHYCKDKNKVTAIIFKDKYANANMANNNHMEIFIFFYNYIFYQLKKLVGFTLITSNQFVTAEQTTPMTFCNFKSLNTVNKLSFHILICNLTNWVISLYSSDIDSRLVNELKAGYWFTYKYMDTYCIEWLITRSVFPVFRNFFFPNGLITSFPWKISSPLISTVRLTGSPGRIGLPEGP